MTSLTLHHGEASAEYVEHPIEVARKALAAAAEVEDETWAPTCRHIAALLPRRRQLVRRRTD